MNLVRKAGLILMALMLTVSAVGPVLGQDKEHELKKAEYQAKANTMFGSPAWGAGIGAGLVIIGAAIGFGRIGAAALESMARQPQTAGQVQTAMIIIGALLEGVAFFALVICFQIGGKVL
jgi:F-type H+-transporting ATPase subunit c